MIEGRRPALLFLTLATDEDDPILAFVPGWINALARHCRALDVVTMRDGRRELDAQVRVFTLGKERGYSEIHRAYEFYRILLRLLRERPYDACLCHMMPLYVVMSAPLLRPQRVRLGLWYAHRSLTLSLRMAESLADVVLTPTPESFPFRSRKVTAIGHGIDTDLFGPAPAADHDRPLTLISVGRLAPSKGLEALLEVVSRLISVPPFSRVRLRLVGPIAPQEQGYAKRLHHLIAELGLQDAVEFTGPIPHPDVAGEYRRADLLVSTSRTGAADKVVFEAMACGLPVVTTNPAFASVLSPWAALLMAPEGNPEALASQIARLLDMTPEHRRGLGLSLRQAVLEQHSLESLPQRLIPALLTVHGSTSVSEGSI